MNAYRVRGLVYLRTREFFDAYVPGGALAVRQALDVEHAQFFEQIFLGSAMYDAGPILSITSVAAQIAGEPHMPFVKRGAAWQADNDLRGVYKLFVRALPPETVACRLPKLALKYFDFGEAEMNMQAARCCVGALRGVPRHLSDWVQASVEGYVPVAMNLAGAKNLAMRMFDMDALAANAHATVTFRVELRWS